MVIVRADSAYYGHDVIAAPGRQGAYFSVTARRDRAVTAAIASIDEQGWTTIRYPKVLIEEPSGCWISDAQAAEVGFISFTSRRTSEYVTGQLIVRRVSDANPDPQVADAQGELFATWRQHTVSTDSHYLC